jgi:hypothetical protein
MSPRFLPVRLATFAFALFLVGVLACAVACGGAEETASDEVPGAQKIDLPELGLVLDPLPSGWRVAETDPAAGSESEAALTLESTDPEMPGTLAISVGGYGHQNLSDAVWAHKDEVEAAGGRYRGQNELGGVPLGTTYVSRAELGGEGGEGEGLREQYRALTLHPIQPEIVVLNYDYVGGTNEERLDDLITVLAALRPAGGGGKAVEGEGGEEAGGEQ